MSEPTRGVIDIRSNRSVSHTVDRLESPAVARGLTIFARIDLGADAHRAGLSMRPMQTLLFGNPKAGTPLPVAAPRTGLDLPLKALAWEDANGSVWLSFNEPEYLEARHGLPQEFIANIAGVRVFIEKAAEPCSLRPMSRFIEPSVCAPAADGR